MGRLTEKFKDGRNILKKGISDVFHVGFGRFFEGQAIDRLAEYEDFEEIFRSKMTDAASELLSDKEEFSRWLDRNKWIAKKCDEYARAEEQGKLLKLPCAVGDTVYSLDRFCSGYLLDCPSRPCESCEDYQFEIYEGKFMLNDINDFGKTVFLTREEAEATLKGLKKDEID